MRVLYLHQYFSTPKGAAGTRSYEFAKELIVNGNSVTMVCGSDDRSVTGLTQNFINGRRQGFVDGIEVIEFDIAYSNYDSFFKRIIKFFKFVFKGVPIVLNKEYDLLFATSPPLTITILGILAKIIKRKPFLLEIRDLWPEAPKSMGVITNPLFLFMIEVLERLAYRFADFAIGLSPRVCEGLGKYGSLSKEQIVLISNGADLEFFQKVAQENRTNIPLLLTELLATKFTAIFCGAHGMANGLDLVLDAAAILQANNAQNIALIFIGDGKIKPYLIARAKKENLNNCYFFAALPKEVLRSVLQQASIGMMLLKNTPAFYYGTSPNKFFDYIASGLPVINNYPGWVAELIQEYKCGVVVPPDSPEVFASALVDFASLNQEQRQVFAQNSLKLAKEKFDRKKLARKFLEVCGQVCKEKRQ